MKTYNILELQKMNHDQLVEVCNEIQPALVSTHKQRMIYDILDRQADLNYKPSELNSRDRYTATAKLEEQLKHQ